MGKLCTYPQLCSRSRISGWPSAMPSSDTLRTLWLSAPPGRLSPWQQAKALALREVSRGLHNGRTQLEWIAARVEKVGGGCPRKPALHQFFKLVGADPEWFPGKHKVGKRGRPPLLTPAKRRHIGNSAMAAKHTQGDEPCVAAVVHACPRATLNPETSLPFCGKTILKVFSKDCYDYGPDHSWRFQTTLQTVFLPDAVKQHRVSMARLLLEQRPDASWWYRSVVWFDPSSSIIPGSQAQYNRMRQALKRNKRWVSDNAKRYSRNLRGPNTALKQTGWEGRRVNWFLILTRGTMHVEVMPSSWRANGQGFAVFVERLPAIMQRLLGAGARRPRTVFTDRGPGMYTSMGMAVKEYSGALGKAGLRSYWGADAAAQSPDMPDLLLHETAVSWFRLRMSKERPVCLPWHETDAQWIARARKVCDAINYTYDVPSLCRAFPDRLSRALECDGERLPK